MNRKILFTLAVILLAVISLSTVNAFWPFDSGNDVTVNGVNFHLPEGFDVDNPIKSESDVSYENVVYKNTKTKDTVDIAVDDKSAEDSVIGNSLIKKSFEPKTIDGKEGFYKFYLNSDVEFVYIDNDKVVSIIVPSVYDKYGDNFMKYEDFLSEIIKWGVIMDEDIAGNVELMPIVKGIVVSIVLMLIGSALGIGFIGIFGIIIGGAISGFSSNNSTLYAVIYGAIVGFVSSFLILYSVFAIPFCIILGIFGGFIGKVIQSNIWSE